VRGVRGGYLTRLAASGISVRSALPILLPVTRPDPDAIEFAWHVQTSFDVNLTQSQALNFFCQLPYFCVVRGRLLVCEFGAGWIVLGSLFTADLPHLG
jgi:hypothetical protein